MEEEDQASKMWMTHICMQATSTMLYMNINIITTGISAPKMFKCVRWQPIVQLKKLRWVNNAYKKASIKEKRVQKKGKEDSKKPDGLISHQTTGLKTLPSQ